MEVIKAKQISKNVVGPDKNIIKILENVDISISQGEFVSVLGPSGSGKTTLLQILGLMDFATSGELEFLGKKVEGLDGNEKALLRNQEVGFVFQRPLLVKDLTVYQNLKLCNILFDGKNVDHKIKDILETVGILNKIDYYPGMLSAGEAQRATIAKAIINDPSIIFADEPIANLDKDNKIVILEILKKLHQEKSITILLATHDDIVLDYSSRNLRIESGKIKQ